MSDSVTVNSNVYLRDEHGTNHVLKPGDPLEDWQLAHLRAGNPAVLVNDTPVTEPEPAKEKADRKGK